MQWWKKITLTSALVLGGITMSAVMASTIVSCAKTDAATPDANNALPLESLRIGFLDEPDNDTKHLNTIPDQEPIWIAISPFDISGVNFSYALSIKGQVDQWKSFNSEVETENDYYAATLTKENFVAATKGAPFPVTLTLKVKATKNQQSLISSNSLTYIINSSTTASKAHK